MIYLIGGAPRVGKSQLMQRFVELKPMPSFSCDFLYSLDQVESLLGFNGADILEKGRLFYPTLKQLLVDVSIRSKDCIIEGEVILPEFISELKGQYEIKCCFLGLSETNLETIISHGGFFNWPQHKLDNQLGYEVDTLADRVIARSKIIEIECQKFGLPYFDLSSDYIKTTKLALDNLLS